MTTEIVVVRNIEHLPLFYAKYTAKGYKWASGSPLKNGNMLMESHLKKTKIVYFYIRTRARGTYVAWGEEEPKQARYGELLEFSPTILKKIKI